MRRLVLLLALLCVALVSGQSSPNQTEKAKIRNGDEIVVTVGGYENYGGDYIVSDDGRLTGVGFGTVQAAGKTVEELRAEILAGLKKTFRDPVVDVVLKKQTLQYVYVIGSQHAEPITYRPNLDLRQVVGIAGLTDVPDMFDCRVSRAGEPVHSVNLHNLLRGDPAEWDGPMMPDDVVTFLTKVFHVTVSGEVNEPGQYVVRDDSQVEAVIAQAKGVTKDGTLKNVLVFRGQDVYQIDVASSQTGKKVPFMLQPGDSVVVRKSENAVYVLGEVRMPGRFVIPDNKVITLADALADAQGLTPSGTLRRVALVRPDANGKFVATTYNLDEFLKSAKSASNPSLQSGDIVLFSTPKTFQLLSLNQIASTAFLLKGIIP
jgi:protein involved in polysaccharide export with SLBB domain